MRTGRRAGAEAKTRMAARQAPSKAKAKHNGRGRRVRTATSPSAGRELRPCEIRKRLPKAVKFLRSTLAASAKAEGVVRSAAAEARIRPEVLAIAIDDLGILQRKPDNGGDLLWRLPA